MNKWPRGEWARPNVIIRVQQDVAPSHINPKDPALLQGLQHLGIPNKVLLYAQPSNSPDTITSMTLVPFVLFSLSTTKRPLEMQGKSSNVSSKLTMPMTSTRSTGFG
jgi:hypothetical protein